MYEIPQSVQVNGVEYPIRNKGDYRMVLDCFEALNDLELDDKERTIACLIIFYENINSVKDVNRLSKEDADQLVQEMEKFFNCGQQESPGMKVNYKLIDWNRDSQLICSAINKVSNKEIRLEPYLHWWTFMGYYLAIGESPLANIVSIRNKIMRGTKLTDQERTFRRDNPQYFIWDSTLTTRKEDDELARGLWNSGE